MDTQRFNKLLAVFNIFKIFQNKKVKKMYELLTKNNNNRFF